MPSRTVSRETSTPFGAAFHSNRRYGPRITGATWQQGACLARRVRRMDRMARDTDVSRETPGYPPVLEIGRGATPFWPVVRRDGRNWLRHHPRPPGVTSGREHASVRSANHLLLLHRIRHATRPWHALLGPADAPPPPRLCFHAVPQSKIRKGPDPRGSRLDMGNTAHAGPTSTGPNRRPRQPPRSQAARWERPPMPASLSVSEPPAPA